MPCQYFFQLTAIEVVEVRDQTLQGFFLLRSQKPSPSWLRTSPPITNMQVIIKNRTMMMTMVMAMMNSEDLRANVICVSWNSAQGLSQHLLGSEVVILTVSYIAPELLHQIFTLSCCLKTTPTTIIIMREIAPMPKLTVTYFPCP